MSQKRKYAAHFDYPDKCVKELGIVREWVALLGGIYHTPACGPHPNQAPDCVVLDRCAAPVGVEVCELVDRQAIEADIAGQRFYRSYGREDFLSSLEGIIRHKDGKDYYGVYRKLVVLVHTDEPDLTYDRCAGWLQEHRFGQPERIDEAYLLFSYDPELRGYRYLQLNMKRMTFRERVFSVVREIPAGETLNYRQVAERAGNPRAFRAVGNILHTNYDPDIPCHRVIRSDGAPGGWNRGAEEKRELLRREQERGERSSHLDKPASF